MENMKTTATLVTGQNQYGCGCIIFHARSSKDSRSSIGYGYQGWILKREHGKFMANGVYVQSLFF